MKILVILASTRQNRFGEKPARWIYEQAKKRKELDVELVDLRDYPLPFFDEPKSPSAITEPYSNPQVQKWTKKVAEADAFIIVTPEYNHGYPAVLKNAIDYVGKEWHNKIVGFVAYGSVGGARAVEQLRQVIIELHMASVKAAVYIPGHVYMDAMKLDLEHSMPAFDSGLPKAEQMLDQLVWWAKALKDARERS